MVLVNIIGILIIVFIILRFWGRAPATPIEADTAGVIDITVVDGVYDPASIEIPLNTPTALRFLRKDPSTAMDVVIFPAMDIRADLPLNQSKTVNLPGLPRGEFDFHAQTDSCQGKIIVT